MTLTQATERVETAGFKWLVPPYMTLPSQTAPSWACSLKQDRPRGYMVTLHTDGEKQCLSAAVAIAEALKEAQ